MGWGGAIIGGIIGAWIFGPWGAVIGGIVGGAASGKSENTDGGDRGSTPHPSHTYVGEDHVSYTHFENLFRSFGKLAKADGLVSQTEADLVTAFLRELGFPSTAKKLLIAAFNQGKTSSEPFSRLVEAVKSTFPPSQYRALMQLYCDLVLADGTIGEVELNFLRAAERVFGLRGFVDRWYDSLRDSAEPPPPADDLDDAYRILGVTPQSTPDEIKKAWRDKAKEFHPDKLRGKNLPESVVKLAESKFRQAQSAYERIKRERNF